MNIFKNENPTIAAAAMSLIPVATYVAFIIACNLSINPGLNETYGIIEASFSRIAEVERKVWLEIIGLVLSIVIPFFYVWKNGGLGKGEGDKTPGHIYAISWFILLLTFLPAISKQSDARYEKRVDAAEFQYYKEHKDLIDPLFPEK